MKYIFVCGNKECPFCKKRIFYFQTDNLEQAEKHSRENNSRMWIAKDEDLK